MSGASELVYASLREANVARQAEWCPEQVPDLSFRGNELAGETGEVCNVIKKLERERLGWRGSRDTVEHLSEELADVVICADLVAISAGIDLNAAVAAKFNATSEKVGLPHRLEAALSASRAEVVALREALAKARGALERDRSQVADGLTKIKAALAGRAWLREGRGSYTYDDERYQQEFGHALDEIGAALEPLRIIAGDWTDCPTDFAEITEARAALAGEKPVGAGVETALASIPQGAIDALRNNQRQLDVDGCEVGVSRQAIDEVLAGIDAALSKSGEKPLATRKGGE